jgi:predicted methyltransferase
MTRFFSHALLALTLLALPGAVRADLATRLADEARAAPEPARDFGPQPAGVLAVHGQPPGDTVGDMLAAGGDYTQGVSIAGGAAGDVYAPNPAVGR